MSRPGRETARQCEMSRTAKRAVGAARDDKDDDAGAPRPAAAAKRRRRSRECVVDAVLQRLSLCAADEAHRVERRAMAD